MTKIVGFLSDFSKSPHKMVNRWFAINPWRIKWGGRGGHFGWTNNRSWWGIFCYRPPRRSQWCNIKSDFSEYNSIAYRLAFFSSPIHLTVCVAGKEFVSYICGRQFHIAIGLSKPVGSICHSREWRPGRKHRLSSDLSYGFYEWFGF